MTTTSTAVLLVTPDWLAAWGQTAGAIGTAAAVGVALWLAFRESRWRRADQAERDAERADRDAAQARLVTVEPTYPEVVYARDLHIVIKIVNASLLPIFDVKVVDLSCDVAPGHTWRIDDSDGDGFKIEFRVLAAGEPFYLPVEYVDPAGRSTALMEAGGTDHVTIEFTDSVGLRWRRRDNDAPVRVIET